MKLHELKAQLVNKNLSPLYVFTGEEIAIMNIYINKIAQTLGSPVVRVDTVGAIYNKVQSNCFVKKAQCYVIRDDKDYATQEKVWETIRSGAVQGENIIILVYTTLDKRTKFYKEHEDIIVDFEKLPVEVLAKYIYKEIGLSGREAETLAEMCECNYSRILLECDKLKHLQSATSMDILRTFDYAVQNNLIFTPPQDVIFDFVDAVCKRSVHKSFELLADLVVRGESPLAMISLLYNNFRAMLLVQSAGDGCNLTQRTGLTPWQVKLAKEKGNHYNISELVRALRLIREAERGIKTGKIEQEMAVDYILVSIL